MAKVRFDVPDPIHSIVKEKADEYDKTYSDVYREYIEEGLEDDGFLDQLDKNVRDRVSDEMTGDGE